MAAIDSLWNLHTAARRARDAACAAERPLEQRIAWVHIPKAGSSLATALYHATNSSLPSAAQMPSCSHGTLLLKPEVPRALVGPCRPTPPNCTQRERERCFKGLPAMTFHLRFPLDQWFRCTFWEKSVGNIAGHETIDAATYTTFRGRFAAMFRQPHDRVVSAFRWFSSEFLLAKEALPSVAECMLQPYIP